jgi:hypothetical protein
MKRFAFMVTLPFTRQTRLLPRRELATVLTDLNR